MSDIDLAKRSRLNSHSGRHEDGGGDEIDVGGLSGVLADQQDPQSHDNARHTENYVPDTQVGANGGVASLDSNGEVVSSQIPDLAINDVFTVTSENDLTTLTDAELGDTGIVEDADPEQSNTYILTGTDPTVLSNWVVIKTPQAPVQSVNNQTGDVNLNSDDVSAPSQTEFDSHSSRHEDGGGDEIDVTGLSGTLADQQDPQSHDNARHTENYTADTDYTNHDHSGSNNEPSDLNPDTVDASSQLDPPVVATRGDIPTGQTGLYYIEDEDTITYRVS